MKFCYDIEEMVQRNQLIDSLRGFSMIVIIFTHATAFFPSDPITSLFWNWSNFAVAIFIFCSAYLYFQKSSDKPLHIFSFLKKRIIRLLVPYYIFLGFFFLVLFIISPEILSFKYIWQSVLVIGGVDINWLVLLFLYITILLPFLVWSQKKVPVFFWMFFSLSLGSAFFLLFYRLDVPYKFIMWLPWSLILYFTWFYLRYENKRHIIVWSCIVSCLLFGLSYGILNSIQHSTVLIHNKYPPNIVYLSYGIVVLLGLVLLSKYLFSQKLVLATINFFSRYSYSIYFLHYLVLTVFAAFIQQLHFTGVTLFLSVLTVTVLLQKFYIWAMPLRFKFLR